MKTRGAGRSAGAQGLALGVALLMTSCGLGPDDTWPPPGAAAPGPRAPDGEMGGGRETEGGATDPDGGEGGPRADTGEEGGDSGDHADNGPGPIPMPPFCEGTTAFAHDPLHGEHAPPFPDDLYTVDLELSRTGLRVDFTEERAPWVARLLPPFHAVAPALSTLDGFSTLGGIYLPFTAPIAAPPSGAEESVESPRLWLVELGEAGARRIPYEARLLDSGHTLTLWPLGPLKPATRHAVLMTTEFPDAEGDCIAPSEALAALLTGTAVAPELTRLHGRYAGLLEAAGISPEQVSAAVVFTTQTIVDDSVAIAQDIREQAYAWTGAATCQAADGTTRCDRSFTATDYSDGSEIVAVDADDAGTYTLTARWWLPTDESERPWPVVIFGHGLGANRNQARDLAPMVGAEGFVTIALDAPGHGGHPSAVPGDDLSTVLGFFGVDLAAFRFDPIHLRDVWRRATADRLQLVELLEQAPDLDGDGVPDVDGDALTYLGASLGGIMGSEFLAMSDRIHSALFMVAGNRLAYMVRDSPLLGDFVPLVAGHLTEGELDRLFALLQTVADRGDGGNYAPHVLTDRFPVGGPDAPDLLLTMALHDDTVPNSTTTTLARAAGIPLVSPHYLEVGGLPAAPATPYVGNLAAGATTAGLFQFDRMTRNPGEAVQAATHASLPRSVESEIQTRHWFGSWRQTGQSEVVDPYAIYGTPPL